MAEVRILATAELPAAARDLLATFGPLEVSRGDLAGEVGDIEVLVVRAERVDAEIIAAAPGLRVIARTGVGVDNVDLDAATARGIPVINAPAAGTGPVAEGTWALILATAKRLGELRACIEENRWGERYAIEGVDLDGATLGVVGLGSIGREVARVGRAFGMEVIGADARPTDDPDVEHVTLAELAERADIITLHCDLNDSTRGLIDRALLQRTTRRPILVNAARGAVIAGDGLLLEALDAGWLSAVGLDVYADEPLAPDSGLLRDARVVCTPHSIGLTRAWNARVFGALATGIQAIMDGTVPEHIVNPEVLAPEATA